MANFESSFKELYSVVIKATSNIEANGRIILPNETIAAFDKIQLGTFDDDVKMWTAHGGWDDRDHVWWESTKDVRVRLTQGIFSKDQLMLLTNAKIAVYKEDETIYLNKREAVESDDNGIVQFSELPYDYFFMYDVETGEKITDFEAVSQQSVKVSMPYKTFLLDYQYAYNGGGRSLIIGSQLTNGFVTFEGKTRVKDDITGQTHTGILRIPKLKLMSDMSIRLGQDASPVLGKLDGVAIPVGSKGNNKVMELLFLNDDIDTDM